MASTHYYSSGSSKCVRYEAQLTFSHQANSALLVDASSVSDPPDVATAGID